MKNFISFFIEKLLFPILLLFAVTACTQPEVAPEKPKVKLTAPKPKVEREISGATLSNGPISAATFTIINAGKADSFSSLAKKYLNDSSKEWMIREYNQTDELVPGQSLIVPKQSFVYGGVSSEGFQTVPVLRYLTFDKKFNKKAFQKQMKFLRTNGYRTISMGQFANFLKFKTQIPSKSVLITIDNNSPFIFKSIYPILKKFNYQAAIFLNPKQIGRGKQSLKWAQVKEMNNNGISIQCKPSENRDWTSLRKNEKFDDFFNSLKTSFQQPKKELLRKLGKTCDFVAYPKGKSNLLIVNLIKKLGYSGGFSLAGWANPFFVDPNGISRFSVSKNYKEKAFIRILNSFQPYSKGGKQALGLPLTEDNNNILLHYQSLGKQFREKKDFPRSLLSWEIAAALDQKNPETQKTIVNINQQIKKQTQIHYKKARQLRKKNRSNKARIEFLKGLYNDPTHKKALYFVTDRMREREYTVYKIKKADTLRRIAKNEYKDENKDFLIAFFNKSKTIKSMKPGEILVLPKLTKEFMKPTYDASLHLTEAKELTDKKKYEEAAVIYKKILTKEPDNKQAMYLKNSSYRSLGQKFKDEKKLMLSKQAYEKVDSDFPGIKSTLKDLVKKITGLAETQYKNGIEFFINDNLKKAILSWKETLRLNPLHSKAAKDLLSAEGLLLKLQSL